MLKRSRRTNFGGLLANLLDKKKNAFTLAETLIALGVIGIIAALTIPSLITTISNTVRENQMAVFERKLGKGADLLNIDNGIGPYYNDTESFVKRLSEHLKIVTICGKDNLRDCITYNAIQQEGSEPYEIEDIETKSFTGIDADEYLDAAGFVLADGTPMVLAFKKDCPISDPDAVEYTGTKKEAKSNNTSCIAGFYDINGNKGPNKFGKDIVGFNGVTALSLPYVKFAGLKVIKSVFLPTGIYLEDYCTNGKVTNQEAKDAGVTGCCTRCSRTAFGPDRWASAMITCNKLGGHLPDLEDLTKVARYVYNNENIQNKKDDRVTGTLIVSRLRELAPSYSGIILWSSEIKNGEHAYWRSFSSNYTYAPSLHDGLHKSAADKYAFCVKN
ncbi:type II secretion system protein [bacterium]|nr:type II secretion system protein [bacterium]